MEIKVPRGQGLYVVNALRQMIYTRRCVLRPIAFSVGNSNVLSAGNTVVEDMVSFSTAISKVNYACKSANEPDGTVIKSVHTCDGVLRISDLITDSIDVLGLAEDKEILHTIRADGNNNASVPVVIFYRMSCGMYTAEENLYFLKNVKDNNAQFVDNPDSYTYLSSRHVDVDNFTYSIEQLPTNDVVHVNVSVFSNQSEEEVLHEAKSALISCMQLF